MAALAHNHRKVQRLRSLVGRRRARQDERAFVVEGAKVVGEALDSERGVESLFFDPAASGPAELAVVERARRADCEVSELASGVLERVAGTVTPQPLLAIVSQLDRALEELPRHGLIVLCADVRDPGNAGTVLRSADAAGADAAVLTGNSVDPYNGKAVRASAGSLFHLPLAIDPDTADVVATLKQQGLAVLAADGAGDLGLDDAIDADLLGRPTAWLFGNEAAGLPEAALELADRRVRVPLHGRAESLNLASAAAVCLYASARAQRP